jgi:hypothetical protein
MASQQSYIAILSACFALGCAEKVTVNLRSVLDEAAQNEIGPTARLADKILIIDGVVVRTGMKDQHSREGTAYQTLPGVVKVESQGVASQVPYAIIEPGDGKPGRCMCFFDIAEIDEVAEAKPKSKIRVHAKLQRFIKQAPHEVLAADCEFPR